MSSPKVSYKLIQHQISAKEKQIQEITATLPYAEGQSYYKDKRVLLALKKEIVVMERVMLRAQMNLLVPELDEGEN